MCLLIMKAEPLTNYSIATRYDTKTKSENSYVFSQGKIHEWNISYVLFSLGKNDLHLFIYGITFYNNLNMQFICSRY